MSRYDRENPKPFQVLSVIREMGRSRSLIECPFCLEQFWAYWWSISGGGKKCPKCGAMHVSVGSAYPPLKPLTTAQKRVLGEAREIGDWFVASDISCQAKVLDALVEQKLLERHHPSGGPYEYRAVN